MTRYGRRKTGGTAAGLFRWSPNGEQPDEVRDNPLLRPCPWCTAAPRQRCRKPSHGGWIELDWCHDARKQPAPDKPQHPARPPQTAAQPPERRS